MKPPLIRAAKRRPKPFIGKKVVYSAGFNNPDDAWIILSGETDNRYLDSKEARAFGKWLLKVADYLESRGK